MTLLSSNTRNNNGIKLFQDFIRMKHSIFTIYQNVSLNGNGRLKRLNAFQIKPNIIAGYYGSIACGNKNLKVRKTNKRNYFT